MARSALPLALVLLSLVAVLALVLGGGDRTPRSPTAPPDEAPKPAAAAPPDLFSPEASGLAIPAEILVPTAPGVRKEGESETEALVRLAMTQVGALFRQLTDVEAYIDAAGESDWQLMEISKELRDQLLRMLTAGTADARLKAALALALIELRPEDVAFLRTRFDVEFANMAGEKSKNLVLALAFSIRAHGDRHGLSRLGDALRTGAGSNVKGFREGAVLVLALTNDEESSPLLRDLLASDPDRMVRKHSAVGLGRIGGEENRGALSEALVREEDIEVRAWSALASGRAAPAGAGDPALLHALAVDPAGEVRGAAAFALSRAGGPGTQGTLMEAFYGNDHPLTRIGSIAGVARRREGGAEDFLESEGSPFLEDVARTGESSVNRFYAVGAMGLMEPSESRNEVIRQVAAGDSSSWVRSGAVATLARTGGEEAVPALQGLLETEKTGWVRRHIEAEIRRLNSTASVPDTK
ncbi:MAG: HEAT repeat domain-containing protein [Planctomycetota bacterium]|jgi:HEAT repeat protein